ncbi:hypothetical protein OBBRIDRAFT_838515 [Obba rivulosa]|uniref:Uncharacterized protein n=1 Tax=Obba rivulosa TaxID=1052685 RepID=A0A8E2AJZ4_9APHY|nr:hypothetical protein OBBRIDRAFT_838515 [Obba rivulosa]
MAAGARPEDSGQNFNFMKEVRKCYTSKLLFSKVVKQPAEHLNFTICNRVVWAYNRDNIKGMCIL